jgi:hypothetical protein
MTEDLKGQMSAEAFEEWLKVDPHPDYIYERHDKTNKHVIRHRTNMGLLNDCLETMKDERGEHTFTMKVQGDWGQVTHLVQYTLSNVVIAEVCPDGKHSFTDWRYDFTGGDLRDCKVCGLTEHV